MFFSSACYLEVVFTAKLDVREHLQLNPCVYSYVWPNCFRTSATPGFQDLIPGHVHLLPRSTLSPYSMSTVAARTTDMRAQLQVRLRALLDMYTAHRGGVQRVLTAGFVVYCIVGAAYNLSGKGPKGVGSKHGKGKGGKKDSKKKKASVSDPAFHARLKKLLRIVIPGIRSREAGMLALHTFFLLARTALSLYVADLDGRIVSALVTKKPRLFLLNLARWIAIAVPATYTNSMIQYLQSELGLAYRTRWGRLGFADTRLTEYVMKQYLGSTPGGEDEKLYYKLANLDDRIKNADQVG